MAKRPKLNLKPRSEPLDQSHGRLEKDRLVNLFMTWSGILFVSVENNELHFNCGTSSGRVSVVCWKLRKLCSLSMHNLLVWMRPLINSEQVNFTHAIWIKLIGYSVIFMNAYDNISSYIGFKIKMIIVDWNFIEIWRL